MPGGAVHVSATAPPGRAAAARFAGGVRQALPRRCRDPRPRAGAAATDRAHPELVLVAVRQPATTVLRRRARPSGGRCGVNRALAGGHVALLDVEPPRPPGREPRERDLAAALRGGAEVDGWARAGRRWRWPPPDSDRRLSPDGVSRGHPVLVPVAVLQQVERRRRAGDGPGQPDPLDLPGRDVLLVHPVLRSSGPAAAHDRSTRPSSSGRAASVLGGSGRRAGSLRRRRPVDLDEPGPVERRVGVDVRPVRGC